MPIRTKCIYEKAEPADGYRVLVMRLWPRGIRKDAVDAWERELGTPTELIKEWKSGSVPWAEFARRYRASMRGQQERMAGLAQVTQLTPQNRLGGSARAGRPLKC